MRQPIVSPTRIRKMTAEDLHQVMEIEKVAFSNPWTLDMVRKELTQEWSTVLLLEEMEPAGYRIRAFAIFWLVHDEMHVLNVATSQVHRKKGFGRQVMLAALEVGKNHKCANASLEVRRSNQPAIRLYESLGFKAVGMRPNYYQDDHEDAVIMARDF